MGIENGDVDTCMDEGHVGEQKFHGAQVAQY